MSVQTDSPLRFGSLFSGVGGMDKGLEDSGMSCRWQCEIDPYCTKVLERHWPNVRRFQDVKAVTDAERVNVIAGGFPCQDVSFAGLGAGLEGERSGLWFEMLRLVRHLRPEYVLVENVSALLIRGMGRVLADLAKSGYDAEWDSIQAGYFGAPHERERIFILAYSNEVNGETGLGPIQNREKPIFAGCDIPSLPIRLQAAAQFIGVDDGLPAGVYRSRVGGVGNAVAPFVSEWIGRRIIAAHYPAELSKTARTG